MVIWAVIAGGRLQASETPQIPHSQDQIGVLPSLTLLATYPKFIMSFVSHV